MMSITKTKEFNNKTTEGVALKNAVGIPDIKKNIRRKMLEEILEHPLSDENALDDVMKHINERNKKDERLTKRDINQILNVAKNFEEDTSIWFILQIGLET